MLLCYAGAATALAAEDDAPGDDTRTILALSGLSPQIQLDDGRIAALTLSGEQVNDEVMRLLAGLNRLRVLRLRDSEVTGEGLAHLKDLPALQTIDLEHTPVSDRDIEQLAALKNVSQYRLYGTRISGMGRQRLAAMLKKAGRTASVDYHRGGYLGVAGSPTGGTPCVITTVVADTPAASIGLQAGDVIVKFDGQAVPDFPALVDVVSRTPPDVEVSLHIERHGETLQKRVALRRRPTQ